MKTRFLAPLVSICLGSAAHAADATWNLNNAGDWATGTNWTPTAAPGATTGTTNPDTATFGTVINAGRIITVDDNRNIFGINFAGNSSAYTLSGGSLVLSSGGTLQTSGAGSGHTDTVSSPITLANANLDTKGSYSILGGSSTATRILLVGGSITGSATSGTTTLTLGGSNTGLNTITGAISNGLGGGNLAVEKTGVGTWVLNATNSFTGGLTLREGEVRLGSAASAGNGTITLGDSSGTASAALRIGGFNATNALTVASGSSGVKALNAGNVAAPGYNGAITLNDDFTIANISNAAATNFSFAGAGDINLNSHTLNLSLAPSGATNTATVTISKAIVGTGSSVVIAGSGTSTGTRTVALSGANTYTDGTTVGGTGTSRALVVNVSNDQSAANGGWNIDINGEATTVTSTVNFNVGSTVAVTSGRTITLGIGTSSGHFGARTLNAGGTVTNDGTLLVRRSSTVNVTGGWTQNGAATLAPQGGGSASLNVNAGGSFTYASGTNFLLNSSGSTGIQTNLTINGGLMTTGVAFRNNSATAPSNTASNVILNDGGTLKLSGNVAQLLTNNIGGISMLLGETGNGGVIDTNGFNTEIDKTIGNLTGQAGKLTKQGLGTLTLSGTNSYTGTTAVTAGTLHIGTGGSLANTTTTVGISGTLAGVGTISGAATIEGIHSPGNSPGTQTFTNSLTYADTASLLWELTGNTDTGRGTNYDAVDVTGGTFTLSSDADLNLAFGVSVDFLDSFWGLDREWLVVDLSGAATAADSNLFTIGSISGGSNYSPALGTFNVLRQPGSNSADSVSLTWTAVPEPSMFALSILGLGGLCLTRRRSAPSAAGE